MFLSAGVRSGVFGIFASRPNGGLGIRNFVLRP